MTGQHPHVLVTGGSGAIGHRRGTRPGAGRPRGLHRRLGQGPDRGRRGAGRQRRHAARLRPRQPGRPSANCARARAGRPGRIDGVIHLVGGWRGAKGITDQSDEDWDFLERSAVTTLRNVTRVFYDDLAASDAGRFAMVSSTAVAQPDGRRRQLRRRPRPPPKPGRWRWRTASSAAAGRRRQRSQSEQHSAAVVFVVKALVDAAMRADSPDASFPATPTSRSWQLPPSGCSATRGGTERPAAAAGPVTPHAAATP